MGIEDLTTQAYSALLYDDEEDYDDVIDELSQYLLSNPNNAIAQNNLGVAYVEIGRDEEAQHAFDSAIQADPLNPVPYTNKGDLHKQKGEHKQAIECFTKAINLKGDASNYLCRGYTLVEMNLLGDALKDFDIALGLDPQNKQTKII